MGIHYGGGFVFLVCICCLMEFPEESDILGLFLLEDLNSTMKKSHTIRCPHFLRRFLTFHHLQVQDNNTLERLTQTKHMGGSP